MRALIHSNYARYLTTMSVAESGMLSCRRRLVGEQPETFGVAWTNGAEVVVVEAGQLGQSEALAHRDDGRIGGAERQGLIDQNQLPRPALVLRGEVNRLQRAVRQ